MSTGSSGCEVLRGGLNHLIEESDVGGAGSEAGANRDVVELNTAGGR